MPFEQQVCTLSHDSSDEAGSECEAPAYSPVSSLQSDFSDRIWPDVDEIESAGEDFFDDEIAAAVAAEEPFELPCEDFFPVSSEESTTQGLVPIHELQATSQHVGHTSVRFGRKMVGDNADTNVKASLQRHENKGQSMHHFLCYAVKDRVPTLSLSDLPPAACNPDPDKLLPSTEDVECIKKEMIILMSRYMMSIMIKKALANYVSPPPPNEVL